MKRKLNTLFTAFLALALSAVMLTGCTFDEESTSHTQSAVQSAQADSSKINIPGYESLEFKAGEIEQMSFFHNPDENACYFRLTLMLDEETLWQSDYIAPGEQAESITLSHELSAGTYQAKLKYECFTLQDKAPLNGAEIELAINVN